MHYVLVCHCRHADRLNTTTGFLDPCHVAPNKTQSQGGLNWRVSRWVHSLDTDLITKAAPPRYSIILEGLLDRRYKPY